MFCLLAAARVAVFSLAFPFFSHVDEHHHFDLVCRYSHGDVPRGYEPFSAEAAALIALYASPEYTQHLGDLPAAAVAPPLWATPAALRAKQLEQRTNELLSRKNIQFSHPPLYYTLAGLWYNLGKMMGVEGGKLLYWAHLFNVPLYALLVWLSYLLAKEVLPTSRFVYLGVPFLLVSFPQDVFYNFNDDVLSGPMVALADLFAVTFLPERGAPLGIGSVRRPGDGGGRADEDDQRPDSRGPGGGGVAQNRTGLVEKTAARASGARDVAAGDRDAPGGLLAGAELLCIGGRDGICPPLPVHDVDAQTLGTIREPSDFHGCRVRRLLERAANDFLARPGHVARRPAGGRTTNLFYVASSTVFLLVFAIATVAGGANMPRPTRLANAFFLVVFALSVAILIHSSIQVDFGHCFSPSRQWPFFSQGRMILGALVPFLIMYLSGLESLLGWLGLRFLRLPLLIILVDVMAVAEIAYSMDVFASPYNWFHLP